MSSFWLSGRRSKENAELVCQNLQQLEKSDSRCRNFSFTPSRLPHKIYQAMHFGFGVEFLSDGTGSLAFKNGAGEIVDQELYRAILVTQQMRFARVNKTDEWIKQM